MSEAEFKKYSKRGAYHWEQISGNPLKANAFVKARYEHCVRLLEQAMGTLNGKKILDMGCGDGALTYLLSRRGAQAFGIDPSEIAIQYARQMHQQRGSGAEFAVRSGYDSGFEDGTFDAVVSTEVIEHVQEPARMLEEIRRILKPGGSALVSTPIRLTEEPMDPEHVVEWFPSQFQALVAAVFPTSAYSKSHPTLWSELQGRSKGLRILMSLFSTLHNPFFTGRGWKLFDLQYVLGTKER